MTENDKPGADEPGNDKPGGSPVPPTWLFLVAIALLVVFVVGGLFMILNADASDQVWRNRFAVFSGFEAIVFTAVGWLFGREVHRGEVATAKQDAADARDSEKAATDEATKAKVAASQGKALADAVDTAYAGGRTPEGQATDTSAFGETPQPPTGADADAARLAMLANLAGRLFPAAERR